MTARKRKMIAAFCLFAMAMPFASGHAYGPRPGPSMTVGQNWYYNPYGRGYYGNWQTNNTDPQGQQVNGPGFSDGYGINVDEYSAYGYGPYGYGNAQGKNYNYYGNAGNYGEGAPPSYSPYGFGGYSRFTNGW
jgi:hypothetical protein